MTNQPGDFLDVAGTTDPETVCQQNTETTARLLFKLEPTYIAGVPNTLLGPPTTLARVLNEVWVDKHLAKWICTVAGTPGTWKQIAPAVVDSNPSSPSTDYWIVRRDLHFASYYWSGASWVAL